MQKEKWGRKGWRKSEKVGSKQYKEVSMKCCGGAGGSQLCYNLVIRAFLDIHGYFLFFSGQLNDKLKDNFQNIYLKSNNFKEIPMLAVPFSYLSCNLLSIHGYSLGENEGDSPDLNLLLPHSKEIVNTWGSIPPFLHTHYFSDFLIEKTLH